MPIYYANTANIGTLTVSSLSATGNLFGTAEYGKTATSADQGNLVVAVSGVSTNTISQLIFSNANNVSFGLNGSNITATVATAGATFNYFNPQDAYLQVAGQIGQSSLFIQPAQIPNVQFDRIAFPVNYSNATNSSNSFTVSLNIGFYTRNVSTLSLASSYSTSYNITNSGTAGSYSRYGGLRLLTMGATNTILEDQYYVAIGSRTATGGGAGMTMSNMFASQINSSFSGIFGAASAATVQYTRGLGMYSATVTAMPSSIPFASIVGNSSANLRQPLFYVVNGTF